MPKHSAILSCSLRRLSSTRSFSSKSHNTIISVQHLLQSPTTSSDVTVNGFIRSIRKQKTRSFAAIGDGTSLEPLQALLTPAQAETLSTGTAVQLTGTWKPSPNSSIQSHELHVDSVNVIGAADPASYPLQKKYHTPEFLRTIPHIRTRTPFNSLLLRFRSQSIAQITKFFAQHKFIQTHPPILTSSDCEGAGEVFGVSTGNTKTSAVSKSGDDGTFFRSPKYLTVSSQLHLEALAQSVGDVWTLSPTFRAEKSDTPRHLSEFYMLEAEVSFVDQLEDVMNIVESLLRDLATNLVDTKVGEELIQGKRSGESGVEPASEQIWARWRGMMSAKWPRITYTDAIDLLRKSDVPFERKLIWGQGLQAEHERYIASNVGHGTPVFVTHYPRTIKPFYMLASGISNGPESLETVECFDLLVPDMCEIVGGSMREYRLPQLLDSMRQHGLVTQNATGEESLGSLQWYVDLRRWGSVPHGGFGLGFDRLIGYLAGIGNMRDVVAFPRWVGRCEC